MKKIVSVIMSVIFLFTLASCGKKLDENSMAVTFVNNSGTEIYGVSLDISLGDDTILTKFVGKGDGKKIEVGESVRVVITKDEFKDALTLSGFRARLKVSAKDLSMRECNNDLKIVASYGQEYTCSLTGDFRVGFYVSVQND